MRKYHSRPRIVDSTSCPYGGGIQGGIFIGAASTAETGETNSSGQRCGWWNTVRNGEAYLQQLYCDGKVTQQRFYSYGRLYKVVNKGQGMDEVTLVTSEGVADRAYSLNAQAHRAVTMFQGMYSEWDCEGNLFLKASFKDLLLHGVLKVYHPNGNLRESCKYIKGVRHGYHKVYHYDGKKSISIEYKKGLRRGWGHSWNRSGDCIASQLRTECGYERVSGSEANWNELRHAHSHFLLPMFDNHIKVIKRVLRVTRDTSSFYKRLGFMNKHGLESMEKVAHWVS